MAEKKFEDYPKHLRITAVLMFLGGLALLAYLAWIFAWHIYNQEWLEAALQLSLFLLGGYWTKNRINKKKIKRLEIELAGLKASRKVGETTAFMKGWQGGINFQRDVFVAAARRNQQN